MSKFTDFLEEMSHKPQFVSEINQIPAPEIPFNLNRLKTYNLLGLFPTDDLHDWLPVDFQVDNVSTRFILEVGSKFYYVDTQGYEYMRYICEIV